MENKRKIGFTVTLDEGDEVIQKEVKKFGGYAGHVILPAKHIGKKAFIIITGKISNNKEDKKQE